jgi:hypothetical protein
MRKLGQINLFLAGAAVCLLAIYVGVVAQRAWLQAQHDAMTAPVAQY